MKRHRLRCLVNCNNSVSNLLYKRSERKAGLGVSNSQSLIGHTRGKILPGLPSLVSQNMFWGP